METLLDFLGALDELDVSYVLGHYRREAITTHVTADPTERWEVEFFDDGTMELERFRSPDERVTAGTVDALLAELRASR